MLGGSGREQATRIVVGTMESGVLERLVEQFRALFARASGTRNCTRYLLGPALEPRRKSAERMEEVLPETTLEQSRRLLVDGPREVEALEQRRLERVVAAGYADAASEVPCGENVALPRQGRLSVGIKPQ
ncbi:MAG: hypothetical protein IT307_14930 [Chloroflexi bacterium]|nr:hypothetical protein [Chloroflexota bacterium]